MTEEERRFKVTKIKKYNSQIQKEKIFIGLDSISVFIAGALAIAFFSLMIRHNGNIGSRIRGILGSFSSSILLLDYLKSMIASISKKTTLELNIEDLEEEIKNYDSEIEKAKGAK